MGISDGQIVDGLNATGLAQLPDGGDKAFGAWVESVLGDGLALLLAPLDGLEVLLWGEASGFTVADEPCNLVSGRI